MEEKAKERLKKLKKEYKESIKNINYLQSELQKQRRIVISQQASIHELENLLELEPTDFNNFQSLTIDEE